MDLTQQAISDLAQITSNANDFGVSITLTAPNGQTATVRGFHVKTHLALNDQGEQVSSRRASIAVSDRVITEANGHYPVRNNNGEVWMKNHLVSVADSTGSARTYQVKDQMPDEKLGLLLLILEDYQ